MRRLGTKLGRHRVTLAYGGDTARTPSPGPIRSRWFLQETGPTARSAYYIGDDLRTSRPTHTVDMPAVAAAYGCGNRTRFTNGRPTTRPPAGVPWPYAETAHLKAACPKPHLPEATARPEHTSGGVVLRKQPAQ